MKPLIDGNDFPASRNSTYLNAASVALMLQVAADAVIEWQKDLRDYGTIHFDELAEEKIYDDLRRVAARLFHVQDEDIAVGTSATELLASLAWAVDLEPGGNIVSTEVVFPSTIYPWARVARRSGSEIRLAKGKDGYVRPTDVIGLIDDQTKVVAISHVEFGTGQRYALEKFADAAHAVGALFIVDATQSAGMLPIDAQAAGVDVLVSAAYKWLCGPFGVAVMYLAPILQKELYPGLVGWRSHEDIWDLRGDRLSLPETAKRFEFSTMAYGCAVGLTQSIEYLLQVGIENIFKYTTALASMLIEGLSDRGVEIMSPISGDEKTAIVAVKFPGKDSAEVASYLTKNQVVVSQRGEFVRFSPHLYNDSEDIEKTLELVDQMKNKFE